MFNVPGGSLLKGAEFIKGAEIDSLEELIWLMQHSVYFKNTIMAFANRSISEDEDAIIDSLKRSKSKSGI
jgi:hypothetical protein